MKQLVKILFHIENKKEQVDKVVSGLHKFFSIPHQDAYEILSKEYVWLVEYFNSVELELDFPEHSTEKDTVIENSETVKIITKAGYTIIRTEELEELKRVKGALKGLCGISRALENKLKLYQMTLEQFQNLKIGDIVVTKVISSKQNRVNPVTNIDRGNLKLHIGRSGKWRSYSQFEVLTAEYVVKWIKRRIDSKSSPHFTIEVKSDTEVTFKIHKKVQFNQ